MKAFWKIVIFCSILFFISVLLFASRRSARGKATEGFLQADLVILSDIKEKTEKLYDGSSEEAEVSEEELTEEEKTADREIRVLLSNQNVYEQETIQISSDAAFTVTYNGKTISYQAGETADVAELFAAEAFTEAQVAAEQDGRLSIENYKKDGGTPSYRGVIRIRRNANGFYAVNELPLEEYLYAVVSSEMPSSYETEALAAQAICARSYAVKNMLDSEFEEYGADLDDTTTSQVYNNVFETEESVTAVQETTGMVVAYGDEVADTYFFSTSCGTTCRNDDVWQESKQPYLNDQLESYQGSGEMELGAQTVMLDQGYFQIADGRLSTEEVFRAFIDNEIYVNSIEKEESFYRWKVTFSQETLENCLYKNIEMLAEEEEFSCYDAEQKKIQTAVSDILEQGTESVLGELTGIEITQRGNSGIAKSMVVYGENASIVIEGQMQIREVFGSDETKVVKQDGGSWTAGSLLPSAYFYIEQTDAGAYVLHGGGLGHGVGMSQNGANRLAKAGYGFETIVAHYYGGATVKTLKEMGYVADEE